ncbi:MAG: MarR family winged helix-turn-helix transcriptional regulator [Campylobacteraceae bacterium]|jgi:MarR family 2-MHQ and catechol resistance regulon transcriptional repressor|nr:MarR family winged helix-turn-helix transcriptional regulator [Campylobacteraceae bacterium]
MAQKDVLRLLERNHTLMHKLKDKMHLSFKGHSHQRYHILLALGKKGKMRLKDIAAYMGMSSPALCVLFSRMEKEGLVTREIDQNDRRNTYYAISKKGHKAVDEIIEHAREAISKVFAPLNDDETKKVSEALETVNTILERYI